MRRLNIGMRLALGLLGCWLGWLWVGGGRGASSPGHQHTKTIAHHPPSASHPHSTPPQATGIILPLLTPGHHLSTDLCHPGAGQCGALVMIRCWPSHYWAADGARGGRAGCWCHELVLCHGQWPGLHCSVRMDAGHAPALPWTLPTMEHRLVCTLSTLVTCQHINN